MVTDPDNLVEAVKRAISAKAYEAMRAQGFSGGWDHDEFAAAISKAAVLATLEGIREPGEVAIDACPLEANDLIIVANWHAMIDQLIATLKDPPHA